MAVAAVAVTGPVRRVLRYPTPLVDSVAAMTGAAQWRNEPP